MRIILLILLIISLQSFGTNYYVSSTGSDSNNGLSHLSPWQSITKVNSFAFTAGDSILFKSGDQFYGTVVVNYSGSYAAGQIVFGAYGSGSLPIVTGFITVTGWTNEGGGIYSKVITSEAQTNMVTIDGVQYGMGRYPNSAFLTYESAVSNTSITDNQLGDVTNWTGAEALIYKNAYRIDRATITNHTSNTLTYTSLGSSTNASAPQKYFIQNDLRTLDQYGEWYHNTANGKFYMYFGAVDPSTKTIKVATLNNLCKINSSKIYVTFEELNITGSINIAIYGQSNNHFTTIQNCIISFAGRDALYIDGRKLTVQNNTISNCNRSSIFSVGTNSVVTGNSITDNAVIIGQGNLGINGVNAIAINRDTTLVQNNTIHNTATNGIFIAGSVDQGLIKNNFVYNTCIWNNDHGSIYTTLMFTNLIIDGNIVDTSGGTGIYLDAIGGYITVKNNSVIGCSGPGLHIHSQIADTIFNNTFFNNGDGVFLQNTSGNNDSHDVTMYNNVFVAKTATQKTLRYYSDYADYVNSFPTYSFYNNIYARPIDDVSSFYYLGAGKSLAQWQSFTGQDATSVKSPISVASENDILFYYNYSNEPVIQPLPFACISLYTTKYPSAYTLQPYTSVVLLKDPNPLKPATEKKPIGVDGKSKIIGIKSQNIIFGI